MLPLLHNPIEVRFGVVNTQIKVKDKKLTEIYYSTLKMILVHHPGFDN